MDTFTRKSSLLYHYMVHLEVWKFVCHHCKDEGKENFTFRHKKHFKEHLTMHYKTKHQKQPPKDADELKVDTPLSSDDDLINFAIDRFNALSKKTTLMASDCVNLVS